MGRIAYVLNGRVPSENGHVIQAVRMCEGFAAADHTVTLYYPDRHQVDDDLVGVDAADFFDTSEQVELRSLPYLDFDRWYGRMDERIHGPLVTASHAAFAGMAAIRLAVADVGLCLTREWPIAYALVKLGVPTVFEIHKTEGVAFSSRGQRAVASIADDPALRTVVTLTDPAATGLADLGIPESKIHVEPDAVRLGPYESTPDRDELSVRLGYPDDGFVVGYTGSLHEGKGVYELVEACRTLDNVHLFLVGGSDAEQGQMRSYLDEHRIENVRLVGRVAPTEVSKYQVAADLLALPPTAEGDDTKHHPEATSPLKLFEYMAAGRPIVATALPGITDVLTDERNALVVPPGDSGALRDAIRRLTTDNQLAADLGSVAASDVREYTWERRASRIAERAGLGT